MTYLLVSLRDRFAALGDETRLAGVTEMLAFSPRPSESINALLARYKIARQRTATERQFTVRVTGCALQPLRACDIRRAQLMRLIQPVGGIMPATDAEFYQLCVQLRRCGHIAERVHGNTATLLQGPLRQTRPGAYCTEGDNAQYERVPLDADIPDVYYGSPPPAIEPWAASVVGGRSSPETSSVA